ncbi:MAG: alanine racemase, partial [Acidobacteriota bacterium]
MNYQELPTPALTIDLDILERNLDRMAAYCREHGLGLRPHTKTHKTPEVARMQMERGAVGLTVAKVGEAEVMAAAGLDKILVAYPIWGAEKLRRLAALARERSLLLSLDNETTAEGLSQAASAAGATVGVLVEFDAGLRRCGLSPGAACLELARKIEKMPGLKFRGLMTYPGNIWGAEADREKEVKQVAARFEQALEPFRKADMQVEIVSGGSTP